MEHQRAALCIGAEGMNSASPDHTANAVPTEPSPQPKALALQEKFLHYEKLRFVNFWLPQA